MRLLPASHPLSLCATFLMVMLFALSLAVALPPARADATHHPPMPANGSPVTGVPVARQNRSVRESSFSFPAGDELARPRQQSGESSWPWLAEFRAALKRWKRLALWLPVLLITPGWLLAWVIGSGNTRPVTPLVVGLSLSLAPLVYLWSTLIGLRLYEPLVQSLFQASALALALWLLRHLDRLRAAWQRRYIWVFTALGLFIVAAIATWLLAARAFLAPPGFDAVASGILAETLVQNGLVPTLNEALPPATLAATLTQMGSYPIPSMLLLGSLILAVSLIPNLYGLAIELTDRPWAALWVIPVVWLWPPAWDAVAQGNVVALYSMTLLPVTVALGLRALRVESAPRRSALLAAFPLAALILLQGIAAFGAWLLALALWLLDRWRAPDADASSYRPALVQSLIWLVAAVILLLPAYMKGQPLLPFTTSGYSLLFATLLVSVVAGRVVPTPLLARGAGIVLILIALPLLVWRTSRPLEAKDVLVTEEEIETMAWATSGTDEDALFLINLRVEGDTIRPVDGGSWLPLYGNRRTVLQAEVDPALLSRAMEPGALANSRVRQELIEAGITHIFLGEHGGSLRAEQLMGQEWIGLNYQSGSSYIFDFLPNGNAGGFDR